MSAGPKPPNGAPVLELDRLSLSFGGLSAQPAVTRQILIGAILIVMMIARPQGLLGSQRVEAPT